MEASFRPTLNQLEKPCAGNEDAWCIIHRVAICQSSRRDSAHRQPTALNDVKE